MATIGLCMIVKDEAEVITRCIESVRRLVDFVMIEDTGSSDGTQEICRNYIARIGLPGEVVDEPWQDFAANRSSALMHLRKHAEIDYALIIDADEQIIYDEGFDAEAFKAGMDKDLYDVRVEHLGFTFSRVVACRNCMNFSYRGVVHEFVQPPPGRISRETVMGFHVFSSRDGARGKLVNKYQRDAGMLEQALATEHDKFMTTRYTFYLAQSYRHGGDIENALKTYLARAELGGDQGEVFYSLYAAAQLKEQLGLSEHEVIDAYLEAAGVAPERAEAQHGASRFCRIKGRNEEGFQLATGGLAIGRPSDGLFIESWIYDWGLLDELAVCGYWSGHYRESLDASERILRERKCPEAERPRIEANAGFARQKLGIGSPALSAASGISVVPESGARYAIITPYYKEDRRLLERCIDSVRNQSLRADHFLVADGFPQDWIDTAGVRHFKLDRSHGDAGNTPRGVGALIAVAEEYSAIGMLDADNWLEPDHVEACLAAASTTPIACDYVIAQWILRRIDGSVMPIANDPNHVDTSSFFFLRGAFCILPHWAMMPKDLSEGCDRVFYSMLCQRDFVVARVPKPTVNFHNLYETSYRALGETPPPGAKPNVNAEPMAWLRSLSQRDNEIACRLIGFISADGPPLWS